MLLPENPEVELACGETAHRVFGIQLESPKPEAPESKGCRMMFSPPVPQRHDTFVAWMAVGDAGRDYPKARGRKTSDHLIRVEYADYLVMFDPEKECRDAAFELEIDHDGTTVLLFNLAPGEWRLTGGDGRVFPARVESGRHTISRRLPRGHFHVSR